MMDVRVSIRNGRVEKWASVRTTYKTRVVAGKRESERLANSTTAKTTSSNPGSLTSIQVEQA